MGPLFISLTVEASNFKFGIQLGLVEELAKKTFKTTISRSQG